MGQAHALQCELKVLNPTMICPYYYAPCPAPRTETFVLQRSWLQTPREYITSSTTASHRDFSKLEGICEGIHILTGFLHHPSGQGMFLGSLAHSDPGAISPVWVQAVHHPGPKMVKKLHKACIITTAGRITIRNHRAMAEPRTDSSLEDRDGDCVRPDNVSSGCGTLMKMKALSENDFLVS